MLDLVSVGSDQECDAYWNTSTLEMSRQLWLPTETEFADLDSSSLTGSSRRLLSNSWFSVKTLKATELTSSQKTFSQSLLSLLPRITALEQENLDALEAVKAVKKEKRDLAYARKRQKIIETETPEEKFIRLEKERKARIKQQKKDEKDDAGKSIRIRVYPTTEQKARLKGYFGCARFIYNKCVRMYLQDPNVTMQQLRTAIVGNPNYTTSDTWVLEYPFDVRDEAMRDFWKNVVSNREKGGTFTMKFKRKKAHTKQSVSVLAKHWNKPRNWYSWLFQPAVLESHQRLPQELKYTARFKKTHTNRYYLCLPKPLEVMGDNQAPNTKCIFFDPGSSPILTGYDLEGVVYIFGEKDMTRIGRLLHYKNKLRSKSDKATTHKKRYSLKRAYLRIYEKIKYLMTDFHCKVTKWLCENYTHIFIPRLNFHKMTKLHKKPKERLASIEHCALVDRMVNKTRGYPWCKVTQVNEAFTTKTCGRCGTQNHHVGRSKTFHCVNNECNLVCHRDVHASVNILLRYFTKRAVTHEA